MSSGLECSSTITARSSLGLLGLSDLLTSTSQAAGTTGMHPYTRLIFVFFVEMGFHHVGQAGLKLLGSRDLPASASQSIGIIGMSHCACLGKMILGGRNFEAAPDFTPSVFDFSGQSD